jgi:uncharacterized protein involved in exopolysaccharide biosynthesis
MENNNSNGEVELRQLVHIFINKKWWFIYTVIAVFLIGIVLTFIFTPKYKMEGQLVINNNYEYYNDFLLENFPEETNSLWLYPESQAWPAEFKYLDSIAAELKSDSFLEELSNKLDYDISKERLKEIILTEVKEKVGPLTLSAVYKDENIVFGITKNAIELIDSKAEQRLSEAYQVLIGELDTKESALLAEINKLSDEQGLSQTEKRKLNSKIDFYENTKHIKEILAGNKDFFVNRVKLVKSLEEGDVEVYVARKRFIVFSLFAAIAIGLIMVYVVNFLQSFRKE